MLTPEKIQELSEPIESIYISMTNELMVNIARHISSPTWTHTARWEIQKLSELGQLTQENAAIINRWAAKVTPEMRESMETTRRAALEQIEQEMKKAAAEGAITPPPRDSTLDALRDLQAQASDRFNLVNTTMLNSTVDIYTQAILDTARTSQEAEAQQRDLQARAAATQEILNYAAASPETMQNSVRKAITEIADRGLTGFVDRAGRHWTPEAYVNMVVRTTVHNTAIESTRARMQDWGVEVFQISAHAGARPRCAPYQGWYCCWERSDGGEIELGDGSVVSYVSIHDTSYGEAAGIFGINCGHFPLPVIAGYSTPDAQKFIQQPEVNDKAYQESQQQRALEREVRRRKRVVEMLGDKATQANLDAVKEAQKELAAFCKETGRTRRPDREKIY